MTKPTRNTDIAGRYSTVRSVDGYARLHEEAIRSIYEAVLQPGDTAIDGGAHSGKHTLPMAAAVGSNGRVLAFEPSPEPFHRLQRATQESRFSNVTCAQKAISSEPAPSRSFLVFADRPGVSGFSRRSDDAGNLPAEEISVETTTIDAYFSQLGPTSFIKLDVEGAELDALRGAVAVVGAHLPVVHVEASYISWDAFGYGPVELLEFCAEYDYRVVDIVATHLDSVATLDESFRTPSVWDYVLLPPTSRGDVAIEALAAHAHANYGL